LRWPNKDKPGAGNLPARVDAVGKLGGDGYSTIRERFELARPEL